MVHRAKILDETIKYVQFLQAQVHIIECLSRLCTHTFFHYEATSFISLVFGKERMLSILVMSPQIQNKNLNLKKKLTNFNQIFKLS